MYGEKVTRQKLPLITYQKYWWVFPVELRRTIVEFTLLPIKTGQRGLNIFSLTKRTCRSDMTSVLVPLNNVIPIIFIRSAPKTMHSLWLRSLKIWKNLALITCEAEYMTIFANMSRAFILSTILERSYFHFLWTCPY